jgi:hypothetical protein
VLNVLIVVALVALAVCAVEAWTFVYRYSQLEWRLTPVGRHLMRLTALLAITYTLTLVFQLVAVAPVVGVAITATVFGLMAVELGVRLWLLIKAQRTGNPAEVSQAILEPDPEGDHQ